MYLWDLHEICFVISIYLRCIKLVKGFTKRNIYSPRFTLFSLTLIYPKYLDSPFAQCRARPAASVQGLHGLLLIKQFLRHINTGMVRGVQSIHP